MALVRSKRKINEDITPDDRKLGEVKSGKTALHRKVLSLPTRRLFKKGLLIGRVLDYGCGYGTDVMELMNQDVYCEGYDPNQLGWTDRPAPGRKYDTIICNYVLNVVTYQTGEEIMKDIKGMLEEGGSAYITVRRDLEHQEVITHRGTYQRMVELPLLEVDKSGRGGFVTYLLHN